MSLRNNAVIAEIFAAFNAQNPKYPMDANDSSSCHEFILGDGVSNVPGYRFVTQEGGGEGGSEHCYSVFEWQGKFYRADYSYASYDGYDMDYAKLREVTPTERLVTFYE
jgi:hypothetical protein